MTIHYKTPVRQEVKESVSEEELSRRQADHMRRVYEEERRRKYLQVRDSLDVSRVFHCLAPGVWLDNKTH